jgi:hypothetical protein
MKQFSVLRFYTLNEIRQKLEAEGFFVRYHRFYVRSTFGVKMYEWGIRKKLGLTFSILFPVFLLVTILTDPTSDPDKGMFMAILASKKSPR